MWTGTFLLGVPVKLSFLSCVSVAAEKQRTTGYCPCGKPDDDFMIACDEQGCKCEWFHFVCVGLDGKSIPDSAAIGAFRSSLLFRLLDVPSQVRFVVDRLLCFLIVGIQASGISIPLSLLML